MKWEYKTIFLPVPIEFDMEGYLNEIGRDGWEVFAATFVDGSNQRTFLGGPPGKGREIPTPKPFTIFLVAKRPLS